MSSTPGVDGFWNLDEREGVSAQLHREEIFVAWTRDERGLGGLASLARSRSDHFSLDEVPLKMLLRRPLDGGAKAIELAPNIFNAPRPKGL